MKNCDKPRQCFKKQRYYFVYKNAYSWAYSFSSCHERIWEAHKEVWAQKNRWFQIVLLEKTLESPLDCKEINQSVLKEINPKYSWEGLMLKLKLQYLGHLIQRADSLEKTLMLGKIEGRRIRGKQRLRWLGGITNLVDMSLSKLESWEWTGKPGMLQFMGWQRIELDWATELIWTELTWSGW